MTSRRAAVALAAVCFCFWARRRRTPGPKSSTASSPAQPHGERARERVTPRGAAISSARTRWRARGLRGGDRGVHEGVRAAGRSGVLFNRAECYRRTGDAEKAVDDYRAFLEKVPKRAQPRGHRGEDRRRSSAARAGGAAPSPPTRSVPPPRSLARRRRRPAEPPRRRRRRPAARRRRPRPKPAVKPADRRDQRRAPTADGEPGGGSRPWVWVALSVLVVGARRRRLSAVTPARRAAAGHGSRQLQVLSVRRRRPTRTRLPAMVAAAGLLAVAACQRDESILLVEVAGDVTLMPAQLSVAVTARDAGRARSSCRPRRP